MGKYFKYAIGEILLVVIGILIALQINNWNENRKDRKKEQELLQQLKSEYQSNLQQLDEKTEMRNQMISASSKLLRYVDHPESQNSDSIIKNIALTALAPTFDPIVNDINSSERIQLLQNTRLREKLARWTAEVKYVTEEEQMWLVIRNNSYMPLLSKYGVIRNLLNIYWEENMSKSFHLDKGMEADLYVGNSKKKIPISNLLDDIQFESDIARCASFSALTNSQAVSLRKRIVEILDLIEKDLK